jgi:MoaA/NifB/PqqE/SkfB family radical SAM enzyme
MNNHLKIDSLWKMASTNLLDLTLRSGTVRQWIVKKGYEQLYQKYVIENEAKMPTKVQDIRCQALTNLLHTLDRAFGDGRISGHVRHSLIGTFVGQLIMGEKNRTSAFREKYGMNPPTFMLISPTQKCNLYCKGCYAASASGTQATLDYKVLDWILNKKEEEWGSHFTVISGGEPLMYRSQGKDFFDVLKEHKNSYFMMYTNSTLIDREAAKKMADAGNVTPAISVEGWEEQTDARRGKGVFRKIQKAMDNLRAEGVPFGISVTATRNNAQMVLSEDFLNYYLQQRGAIYCWIFQYMPIGRGVTVDMMVTPEQRKWMLNQELKMIYEKKAFVVDFWNGGPMSTGCISAGRSGGYFHIDWNGNVSPCAFFPYWIDNVYEVFKAGRPLSSLLMSDFFKHIRKWQDSYAYKKQGAEMGNLLRPCPIRDHHRFANSVIKKVGANPVNKAAEEALSDPEYKQKLISYDEEIKRLLDPIWQERFLTEEKEAPRSISCAVEATRPASS